MIRLISSLTAVAYLRIAKPVLFRFQPDSVHAFLIKTSPLRQRLGWANKFFAFAWAYENKRLLGQTISGVYFQNPLGLSAGFDKNIELLPTMKAIGFGFMTGGSVTFHSCDGNPHPWYYRLPRQKSLVVYAGLPNHGTANALARIRQYKDRILNNFPLVVSVAKTNSPKACKDKDAIDDYLRSLILLKDESRVSVVEINISCPNTYGGEPFTDALRLEQLLNAVDALKIQKPVWIKMPINLCWEDFERLLQVIVTHRIAGVTIGNLNKQRGEIPPDELPSEVKGNLSGLPTQALSDNLIKRTYAAYGDRLVIVGVGGIFSAEDAYRKIKNGASLVGLVTGMIYQGPQLIGQINRQLAALLEKDGFSNVHEAVGSAHQK